MHLIEGRWKVFNPVYLPRASPIAVGEWDPHRFLCIYNIFFLQWELPDTWTDMALGSQPETSSRGCQDGGLVKEIAPEPVG